MDAFKSAVTNYWISLIDFIHQWFYTSFYFIIYLILLYIIIVVVFWFCTFTVMGKNRKALYRLSQSCFGTFLDHSKMSFLSVRASGYQLSCPISPARNRYVVSNTCYHFTKKPNKSIASLKYCYCFFIDILSLVNILTSPFLISKLLSLQTYSQD